MDEARLCRGERPVVYEAVGATSIRALHNLVTILYQEDVEYVLAINLSMSEDGRNIVTAYC